MSTVPAKKLLTPEEYLTIERVAEFKSEYRNGHIVAMPRANRQHNLITGNVLCGFHRSLLEQSDEVYTSNMRLKVSKARLYTYPDAVIVCN